jgi:hypothetical protein
MFARVLLVAVLIVGVLFGCNAVTQITKPAATSSWVFCANEYSGCSFTGLRDVRFTVGDKVSIRSYYGGLESCNNGHFDPIGIGSGGGKCEYSSVYKTTNLQNPMPGMSGLGATVAVPAGHPGYSEARVQPTADLGTASDIGAFRVPCEVSHFSFNDPLVFPGKPGVSHLHMFFGNTGTDANSTVDSILNSGNSTCGGGILDRTAYWVPALIDGTGNVVLPDSAIFYYKTGYNGIKPNEVKAIPKGLRMISGNGSLSSAQGQGNWGCTELYIGHKDSIQEVLNDPRCPVGNHLQLSIEFPQCWDNKNLDSGDHKSHLVNPVNNVCPSTHPIAIPVISFNIRFPIPQNAQDWHLSSDMYDYASKGGGFSAHGDWWDGWDSATEEAWIKNCDNASKDCHGYLLGDGRTLY